MVFKLKAKVTENTNISRYQMIYNVSFYRNTAICLNWKNFRPKNFSNVLSRRREFLVLRNCDKLLHVCSSALPSVTDILYIRFLYATSRYSGHCALLPEYLCTLNFHRCEELDASSVLSYNLRRSSRSCFVSKNVSLFWNSR